MSKKLLTFTVLLIFIVAIEAACAAKMPNPTADSPLVLDSLTAKQQSILIDAGKIASDYCREISDTTESEIIRSLKVKGVSITEVDDITPWQGACSDLIISKTASNYKLYNDILALNQ